LLIAPSALLIAVGLWWTANTIAHNFIHLPFFDSREGNALFSVYLSLLLGVPQTLWRDRHMAHHAGKEWRMRWNRQMIVEIMAVACVWAWWASHGPAFFAAIWLPGWVAGLLLCQLQGYFEHSRGTVSHYGKLYNFLFFNDGYHVEHHARPGLHWSSLPRHAAREGAQSRFPAVLRWLELAPLDALERLVLRSRILQDFVLIRHLRAFERLLPHVPPVENVTIVGGALFPRTALIIQKLAPDAGITIVDHSGGNIMRARGMINHGTRFVEETFDPSHCGDADLVIFPLAYDGKRERLYSDPPAPVVFVHDWIWRRRGEGVVISYLLLKRLNLVRR
jgi:hypothetical protein